MKKITKRFIALILTIVTLLLTMALPVGASYSYYNSYNYSTGALWWKKNYTAKVYRDPNYILFFRGSPSVTTGFEYKGSIGFTLTQTRSFTLGAQSKSTLNANVDFKEFGVPAKVGGSIDATGSVNWGIINQMTRTVSKSAPRGYYCYNICLSLYKIKIIRYQNGVSKGSIEFVAPRGQLFRSMIYNKNVADYKGAKIC